MCSDWPTTPISRCKKRLKLDIGDEMCCVANLSDENNSNQSRLLREKTNFCMLQSKENILNQNQSNCDEDNSIFHLTEHPSIGHPASMNDCLNEASERFDSEGITDHVYLSPQSGEMEHSTCDYWPFIEVDELATRLKAELSIDSFSRSSNITCTYADEENFPDSGLSDTFDLSSTTSLQFSESDKENLDVKAYFCPTPLKDRGLNSLSHTVPNTRNRLVVIDCRYPYEFSGGHIRGAINLAEWPKLKQLFFGSESNYHRYASEENFQSLVMNPNRTTFVLHCEFSSCRAPKLFNLLRNHDRLMNISSYPALRYPHVFVLRGGYAAFFKKYPQLCVPPTYTKMHSRPDLSGKWTRYCKAVNRRKVGSFDQSP